MKKDKLFNFYVAIKQFYQYALLFNSKLDNNTVSVADIINLNEKFNELEKEYLRSHKILSIENKFYYSQLKECYRQILTKN